MGKSENLAGMAKGQILNKLKPGSNGTTGSIRHGNVVNLLAGQLSKPQAVIEAAIKELIRDGKVTVEGKVPYITCLRLSDAASEERAPFIPTTPEQKRQSRHAVDPRGYGYPSTIRPGNPNYRNDLVERNATPEEWLAMGHTADTYPFSEQASFDVAEVADVVNAQSSTEPVTALSELNEQVLVQFIKDTLDGVEYNLMLLSELKEVVIVQFGVTAEEVSSLISGLRDKQVIYWHRISFGGAYYVSFNSRIDDEVKVYLKGAHPTRAQALTRLEELIDWIRAEAKNHETEAIPTEVIASYHIDKYGLSKATVSKDLSLLVKAGLIRYKMRKHKSPLVEVVKPLTFKQKLNLALEGVRETAETGKPLKQTIGSRIGSDSREAYNFARYLRYCGAYRYLDRQNPVVDLQSTPITDEQVESVKQLIASGLYTPQVEPRSDIAQALDAEEVLTQEVVAETQQVAAGVTDQVVAFDDLLRRLTQRVNDLKGQNAALSEQCGLLQQRIDAKDLQLNDLTLRVEALELALALERERLAPPQAVLTPQVDPDTYAKALSMLED